MKRTLSFVALAIALGAPLAALAGEDTSNPSAQPIAPVTSGAKVTEKTNLVTVKSEKRSSLADFEMPKYLTVQQQNDAFQRAYDAQFGLNRTP